MNLPHVVIVGGGFGGLAAAKKLSGQPVKVSLIDKKNYHLFQPLLYQVATAALSPAEIAFPLRSLLSNSKNVEVFMDTVLEIDKKNKTITTTSSQLHFDYLILACGSTYTYFNSPEWEPFAPGLKTIKQAVEIRRRVLSAFEMAEKETDQKMKQSLLTFVVVGGGPTGVELAGSLGEITRFTLKKDFRHIHPSDAKIILVEAGPTILPSFTKELSQSAVAQLQELGVEVRVGVKVSAMNEKTIQIGESIIETNTIIWAAGVAASPLNKKLDSELDRQGRILVNQDCSLPEFSFIFVIGDQAHFEVSPNQVLPGLAPVAMQQGRFVAKTILSDLKKEKRNSFRYIEKGQMATIGRSRAVAMYKQLRLKGFMAWIGWLVVHIYYLVGFKNRFFVIFQWAWTYFTFRRGARLIINDESLGQD